MCKKIKDEHLMLNWSAFSCAWSSVTIKQHSVTVSSDLSYEDYLTSMMQECIRKYFFFLSQRRIMPFSSQITPHDIQDNLKR